VFEDRIKDAGHDLGVDQMPRGFDDLAKEGHKVREALDASRQDSADWG
jgi:hypothetical protein